MIHLRRSILQVVVIISIYNLNNFTNANLGLEHCKAEMKKVFENIQKPLIECAKYAIRNLILYDESGKIIKSYNPDVVNYYLSFINKVSGDDIRIPSIFCNFFRGDDQSAHQPDEQEITARIQGKINKCLREISIFGSTQQEVLKNAMYYHKMLQWNERFLELKEMEQRGELSFEEHKYKHTPDHYGYEYLEKIARAITLIEETTVYIMQPNRNDVSMGYWQPSSSQNTATGNFTPEEYCVHIHRQS